MTKTIDGITSNNLNKIISYVVQKRKIINCYSGQIIVLITKARNSASSTWHILTILFTNDMSEFILQKTLSKM